MSKTFVIRVLGLSIILADCFFVLLIWHNTALAKYVISKIDFSIVTASIATQPGAHYGTAFETTCDISEALNYLGAGKIGVYLIFLVGLILCIFPRLFTRKGN